MKTRLFERKTREHSFLPCRQAGWRRKTTVRIVALAVVFVLLSPLLLVPKPAHAFSFSDLAGNVLSGAFGGGKSYVGGSVTNYLTGKLGSGFGSIVNQKIRLQGLYKPAMKEFMEKMDKEWVTGIPGFFTVTLYYPQKALQAFVGSGEQESFQQSGDYTGIVQNAEQVAAYHQNQSAAQTSYQQAQQGIEEATGSGATNVLDSDSQLNRDIAASQAAFESTAVTGLMEGGGGFWGGLFGGITKLFLPF